ncbi:MAG: class I SAM-dependent methyltransferase [Fretibacterium sp.]|nr:class I SAM-dependent methyltransferase [Fretibacterium sp.]
MNLSHAKGADWAMKYLDSLEPSEIVDLGCGGGRNAAVLLKKFPSAKVTAIDYSPLSVEKTREYNRDMIAAGRCVVQEGNVRELGLESGKFGLATAFETIYFWPGLSECFREVARVLQPGGRFLVANETTGTDSAAHKFEKIIDGMKAYTVEEIEDALKSAGFTEVHSEHHPSWSWIAVLAKK